VLFRLLVENNTAVKNESSSVMEPCRHSQAYRQAALSDYSIPPTVTGRLRLQNTLDRIDKVYLLIYLPCVDLVLHFKQ